MAIGNSLMQMETGTGWSRGLNNLLRAELGRWFGARRWWVQTLIMAVVVIVFPMIAALKMPGAPVDPQVMLFNLLLGIAAPIAVCIIMQEAIAGERQSGTAAWTLSKPVSRLAFIGSKLAGNAVGIAVTMVLVQGLLFYAAAALLMGTLLPPLGVLAALGVQLVNLYFYVGLTLLLGALSSHRGPVIAVPLAVLLIQQYIPGFVPSLVHALPWDLTAGGDFANMVPSVATALMTGVPPASYLAVVTTLGATVLFIVVAALVFRRQEL
jgi:ABC-2 type transport system permease protein